MKRHQSHRSVPILQPRHVHQSLLPCNQRLQVDMPGRLWPWLAVVTPCPHNTSTRPYLSPSGNGRHERRQVCRAATVNVDGLQPPVSVHGVWVCTPGVAAAHTPWRGCMRAMGAEPVWHRVTHHRHGHCCGSQVRQSTELWPHGPQRVAPGCQHWHSVVLPWLPMIVLRWLRLRVTAATSGATTTTTTTTTGRRAVTVILRAMRFLGTG